MPDDRGQSDQAAGQRDKKDDNVLIKKGIPVESGCLE
jgi:hypothetical protein